MIKRSLSAADTEPLGEGREGLFSFSFSLSGNRYPLGLAGRRGDLAPPSLPRSQRQESKIPATEGRKKLCSRLPAPLQKIKQDSSGGLWVMRLNGFCFFFGSIAALSHQLIIPQQSCANPRTYEAALAASAHEICMKSDDKELRLANESFIYLFIYFSLFPIHQRSPSSFFNLIFFFGPVGGLLFLLVAHITERSSSYMVVYNKEWLHPI